MDQKTEIRSYIKCRIRLNIDSKQIFNELCGIYGLQTISFKCSRELLKTYKGCNSRVISNLLTGDETWVHMFEPQRSADNKQWKRKDKKTPMYCQENHKVEKDVRIFNSSGPVVQVPCPSGHTVTSRFYKNSVLKKVKKVLQ